MLVAYESFLWFRYVDLSSFADRFERMFSGRFHDGALFSGGRILPATREIEREGGECLSSFQFRTPGRDRQFGIGSGGGGGAKQKRLGDRKPRESSTTGYVVRYGDTDLAERGRWRER